MFEYFRGNYVWNLATNLTLGSGGLIGEIDTVARSIVDAGLRNDDPAQEEWVQAFMRLAGHVHEQARRDEQAGHLQSAGRKLMRAANYYFAAERQTHPKDPRKTMLYKTMLECFQKGATWRREPIEWVEIPYEGKTMPALFVPSGLPGRSPCMIHFDGLDVNKETIYLSGIATEARRRGVAMLIVDHPGVGEALRLRGMHGTHQIEKAATASMDWLEQRTDVDAQRVGIMALSLGGYYAPRAAAFEKRLKCCIAFGAQWNWHRTVLARLSPNATTQRSVSHFAEHLNFVFGKATIEESLQEIQHFNLESVAAKITCPFLVVHGENDRQVPLADAQALYQAAVNSLQRELRVFTIDEGGAEHCQADNGSLAADYMADWFARVLGGQVA
ncbi:MAG: alpha/beta hydrolase family protein [Limnohabitans sp.]